MTLTVVHTKTFPLMNAWASTLPWDCLVRPTNCVSKNHDHDPMVNQVCAAPGCTESLVIGEVCYAVTEIPRDAEGREQWVCWRHVRPDEGPIGV